METPATGSHSAESKGHQLSESKDCLFRKDSNISLFRNAFLPEKNNSGQIPSRIPAICHYSPKFEREKEGNLLVKSQEHENHTKYGEREFSRDRAVAADFR